jgi:diaminopimelate decarboxylase
MNTPKYIIDTGKIKNNYLSLSNCFPGAFIAYSYKTNTHPSIIRTLANLGSGFVASSLMEYQVLLKLGIEPDKIIYHAAAQTDDSIDALLSRSPYLTMLSSYNDYERFLGRISATRLSQRSNLGLRINFRTSRDSSVDHHVTSNKFGLIHSEISEILNNKRLDRAKITTLGFHLGTNIMDSEEYLEALDILTVLSDGIDRICCFNIGGGFPCQTVLAEYSQTITELVDPILEYIRSRNPTIKLIVEPGRSLVEDACRVLATIISINRNWIILDIASNFLVPLTNANYIVKTVPGEYLYNFGGNLCYDGDIIALNIQSQELHVGDMIEIANVGAYTYSFRSQFGNPDPEIEVVEE